MPGVAGGTISRRHKREREVDRASRLALRPVLALVAIVCLPLVAGIVLISQTAVPDLFELTPKKAWTDGYLLLYWPDLERPDHVLRAGPLSAGAAVRALGYMMEGRGSPRDGELVSNFVLLPDAGNVFHPAHRFGDEMIEVELPLGQTVRFSRRSLVWVWGTLRALPGNRSGPEPLYVLESARTTPAAQAELTEYFR
jgi:hypothetical protein